MPTDPAPPRLPPKELDPVAAGERVEALDVLRGFALFGVLVANLHFWFRTTPLRYAFDPHPWPGLASAAVDNAVFLLVSSKFMTLFSILFGIGLSIQLERAEARGARFFGFAARRLAVLLFLGAAHVGLLWSGDILHVYALLGFLLLPFLRRKARTIHIWTGVLLAIPVLAGAGMAISRTSSTESPAPPDLAPIRAAMDEAIQAYGHGTWMEVAKLRINEYVRLLGDLAPAAYLAFLAFLVGLAVWKSGIVKRPGEHVSRLKRVLVLGLCLGLALGGGPFVLRMFLRPELEWVLVLLLAWSPVEAIALALTYGAGLLLLLQREQWRQRLSSLGWVGRMALTNYLMHSVVCPLIFYGYGLGLYDSVSPAVGLLIAIAIFGCQILFSRWWLRRFRFGPVEWVWRSLAYGKAQRMRVTAGG